MIYFLLILAVSISLGVIFLSYWPMYGAPYVPTVNKEISEILKRIKLKKGQVFCDIGCGDGRMVFEAARVTRTKTLGVDINWGLIQWCKTVSLVKGYKNVSFEVMNFFKRDLPAADIYYAYLWPGVVEKVAMKIVKMNIPTKIVTKSFEIKSLNATESFLINGSKFWVYRFPR